MPGRDRRVSKREKERESDIASKEESWRAGGQERGREKRGRRKRGREEKRKRGKEEKRTRGQEEERKRGRDIGTQITNTAMSPAPKPLRLAQPL
jgi:hypothetical protein